MFAAATTVALRIILSQVPCPRRRGASKPSLVSSNPRVRCNTYTGAVSSDVSILRTSHSGFADQFVQRRPRSTRFTFEVWAKVHKFIPSIKRNAKSIRRHAPRNLECAFPISASIREPYQCPFVIISFQHLLEMVTSMKTTKIRSCSGWRAVNPAPPG